MTANRSHICSACDDQIKPNDMYLGNSYSAFCESCGKKKQKGELIYNQSNKNYINLGEKKVCDYCEASSTGYLHGHAVCDEHIGKAVEV